MADIRPCGGGWACCDGNCATCAAGRTTTATTTTKEMEGKKDEKQIFEAALSLWGSDIQRIITIEELSELQKELCKSFRFGADRPHLAEEIADVQIMLEQMMILYECRDDVALWRRKKVFRLRERLMRDRGQTDG